MTEPWQAAGFGIYVHWPYCAAKCPYCDFNSHVAERHDHDRWARAYRVDLRRVAELTGPRVVSTVFFGGGTPSLMAPETVAAVLDEIARLWPMANAPEVTLEANPTSVEAARFAGFRAAGVNRVSMGIQALDDAALRSLGRRHDVAEALAAFEIARAQFDRVSFDLIYARQDQSPGDWAAELDRALALAVDHLSLYQLTIETGTPFAARLARGGLAGLPDEDRAADLWDITQERTTAHGLPAYEVSNHARPGAESRHNLVYWRGGDWAGIGPGAHGRLTFGGARHATEAPRDPETWLAAVETTGAGGWAPTPLSAEDQALEYLMMALRLSEGADRGRLQALGFPMPQARLAPLETLGLLSLTPHRLRATPQGRRVLDALLTELVTG